MWRDSEAIGKMCRDFEAIANMWRVSEAIGKMCRDFEAVGEFWRYCAAKNVCICLLRQTSAGPRTWRKKSFKLVLTGFSS